MGCVSSKGLWKYWVQKHCNHPKREANFVSFSYFLVGLMDEREKHACVREVHLVFLSLCLYSLYVCID